MILVSSSGRSLPVAESSFSSPRGVFDFQAQGVAQFLEREALLCTWQTGMGKSVGAIVALAFLLDEGMADLIMVACESSKLMEWAEDIRRFTTFPVLLYHGSPAKRAKLRVNLEQVRIIVGTYETLRNDLMVTTKVRRRKTYEDGPLLDALRERDPQGMAVFYDESTRLKNRRSGNYRAQERMLKAMRADRKVWAMGLTATPVESSPDDTYNQFRLLAPSLCPGVAQYEASYVQSRDPFGRGKFKNLSPNDPVRTAGVVPFTEVVAPIVSFKAKTDPDVVGLFPAIVEEPIYVPLEAKHRAFYDQVNALCADTDDDDLTTFGVLRQAAGYPLALTRSQAVIARQISEVVGERGMQAIPSSKTDVLIERLRPLIDGQGAKVVVFTFFGQSILPLLAHRFTEVGWNVVEHHGAMNAQAKAEAQSKFRFGDAQIFVSSDAGARGINLPEASYVCNFELPLTAAGLTQRMNRLSRIGAGGAFVNAFHMVAKDTIEEAIVRMIYRRTDWGGRVLSAASGEDDRLPSSAQRALFSLARDCSDSDLSTERVVATTDR